MGKYQIKHIVFVHMRNEILKSNTTTNFLGNLLRFTYVCSTLITGKARRVMSNKAN